MRKLRILSIVLLVCLMLPFCVSAARGGSLLLQNVSAPVEFYKVADKTGNAVAIFAGVLSEGFAETAMTPDNARKLQSHAKTQNIPPQIGTPDTDKKVSFAPLEEGYYLICSTVQPGEFAPFLIRVPMIIGDKTVYDIQASPKVGDPDTPDTPGKPVEPQPNIPQTGNIQWPKYLLLILGGMAIIAGFAEVVRGREKRYE